MNVRLSFAPAAVHAAIALAVTAYGPAADASRGVPERLPLAPFLKIFPKTAPGAASGGWTSVDAFPNLTFEDPVAAIAHPALRTLYICGRQGTVHVVPDDPATTEKILLLDLSDVTQGMDDCGLLNLALHPEFGRAGSANRGYFFVCYQFSLSPINSPDRRRPPSRTPGYNRVSRFTVPDGWFEGRRDPRVVRASETVLINQFDEHVYHSMGGLLFGDDGFLYVTNGDEGDGHDSFNNAQKIDDGLFSGVLRIDVNNDPKKSHPIRRQPRNGGDVPRGWPESFTAHYSIPNDNPWVDASGANLEEFWAIGLRSPHRMTFDPVEKRLWVGDIGQRSREEVNIIRKGGNYGWSFREGSLAGPKPRPEALRGVEVAPVYEYGRGDGDNAVIGGYVYRGAKFPELHGKYIFGDNTSGRFWALSYDGINPPAVMPLLRLPWFSYSGLSSLGVDTKGELLFCKLGWNSKIHRLARVGAPIPDPPALLSQTGVFADLKTLTPVPGILPYEVNSPLWSDGAVKRRWIAVPNDGAPYGANATIGFSRTGEWTFPNGTVFIKHFELALDERNPATRKRLETRFLVRDESGGVYGVTYRWRADGSDADLLRDGAAEEIAISTANGKRSQTWQYPSRGDCITCHNANAGHVLGVNARQLNGDLTYLGSGPSVNQLRAWSRAGLFAAPPTEAEIAACDRLVAVIDTTAPLVKRLRSYLDANCAQCHRPGGVQAYFDARFDTPLARQGIINGTLVNSLGNADARVVAPQRSKNSILHARLGSTEEIKMPTLARNVVDQQAMAALSEWIASLAADAGTRPADRIAVLTNHDVHFQQRSRLLTTMYLTERTEAVAQGGRLGREEIAVLKGMLRDPETFIVAHVLLTAKVDGILSPGNGEMNGLLIESDVRGAVSVDPEQRLRLAAYWERKLAR